MMLHAADASRPQGVISAQGNATAMHEQSNNPMLASKWQALLIESANVFKQPREPVSKLADHCIDLIDPHAMLPKPRQYRMSEDEWKAVKDTIDDYLAHGWIRPSTDSYGTPVIALWKKTGELRDIIDYRLVIKQTRLDSYPIPRIDEFFDCFARAKYFNQIDLASG